MRFFEKSMTSIHTYVSHLMSYTISRLLGTRTHCYLILDSELRTWGSLDPSSNLAGTSTRISVIQLPSWVTFKACRAGLTVLGKSTKWRSKSNKLQERLPTSARVGFMLSKGLSVFIRTELQMCRSAYVFIRHLSQGAFLNLFWQMSLFALPHEEQLVIRLYIIP